MSDYWYWPPRDSRWISEGHWQTARLEIDAALLVMPIRPLEWTLPLVPSLPTPCGVCKTLIPPGPDGFRAPHRPRDPTPIPADGNFLQWCFGSGE